MVEILSEFLLGDMVVTYLRVDDVVGFEILPLGLTRQEQTHPSIDPLIQVSFQGDPGPGGFAAGHTLRGGGSLSRLRYKEQLVDQSSVGLKVATVFHCEGAVFLHVLEYRHGLRAFRLRTEIHHGGPGRFVLEMLSSFALGGISPLASGQEPLSLVVHRIRSTWSNEGRVDSEVAEDLQLEPSWSLHGVRVERFGQVGSLPVRKFFPFVAVEDVGNSVVWAVQVACPSSWQIELWRRGRALGVSGGLADFEMGHWTKTVEPGESFVTPWSLVTVAKGNLDGVSQRLLDLYQPVNPQVLAGTIPQVFNEFCSSWGQPSHERILRQLDSLRGRGLDHFVIDAGWYADPDSGWELNHGDWEVGRRLFPAGLGEAAKAIRGAGLRPGIWFELETCGPRSRAFQNTDHLLQRHGSPITSGQRRFWDLADPWVVEYLGEKVIGRLKADGFEYIKIDYNESLGVGCDGGESLGHGLMQRVAATQDFFRKIRQELPGVVIENCASGGHRLEASMVALSDFSSFSDAHECLEIPVIAANLHRVVPPWHTQIWAVIRKADSPNRIVYSMTATFLGVVCLSGDVEGWASSQWALIEEALRFHRRISGLLCRGTTSYFGPRQPSFRLLVGWQGILRVATSNDEALVVVHSFAAPFPGTIEIPLPWDGVVVGSYGLPGIALGVADRKLRVTVSQEYAAVGVHLVRVAESPDSSSG